MKSSCFDLEWKKYEEEEEEYSEIFTMNFWVIWIEFSERVNLYNFEKKKEKSKKLLFLP